MSPDRRPSLNGTLHEQKNDKSLADRQRKATEEVAGIMDQINKLLAEAEKKLKALQPTADVSLSYSSDSQDNRVESHRCIGFVKYQGAWRICHSSYDEDTVSGDCTNQTAWIPLADCPRWLRVEVACLFPEKLPELQQEIVKTAEDFVPKARKALSALREALA